MARSTLPGQVIGTPGGSLHGATWAANADVARTGARGEERTAVLLDALARRPGGPTVLHDVEIRQGKAVYNVDHVVVSGRDVYLVDSKSWAGGWYVTLRGVTFRGAKRFPYADKKTMGLARTYLTGLGLHVTGSVLAVWPSSKHAVLHLFWARNPTAKVLPADAAVRWVARRATKPADPATVATLTPLVVSVRADRRSARRAPGGQVEDFPWAA